MDDSVKRAMLRWPNVPAVVGWLRLDGRGEWLVKNAATDAFERITNAQITQFIARNYLRDPTGRYYFQNGPQRVYVALDHTPYVYRINDDSSGLAAHTDAPSGPLRTLLLDPAGQLVIDAQLGVGVLLDRDLPAFLDRLIDENPGVLTLDAFAAAAERGITVRCYGDSIDLVAGPRADLPRRFHFVQAPFIEV